MQRDTWIDLFQKVPPDYHDKVLLVTSGGLEISLQSFMRLEDEYAVIRGRLAGTTDTGRVFFIPYGQISFLCVQKPMNTADIRAMYGEPPGEEREEAIPVEQPAAVAVPDEDLEKTQPLPDVPEAPSPAVPSPRFSKAELLARLRSRSNSGTDYRPTADQ